MSMTGNGSGLLLALTARIPFAGIEAFLAYEARVLPLLGDHGGILQRRLRIGDGTTEFHIVRFAARAGFESFRNDPRRAAASELLTASGAVIEVVEVLDVI
jgi:hypothetical protein